MTNESQAIELLKELVTDWYSCENHTNDYLDASTQAILGRIETFLKQYEQEEFSRCCGDPADCDCIDEPGYGSGI